MTVRELTQVAGAHPVALGIAVVAPVVLAVVFGLMHGKGRGGAAPWKYFYSVLVYAVCVPGLSSSILTAYAVFFRKENMLDVNPLIYFVPIISMIVTLVLIRKNVSFDEVPGFDRLSGLMVMIGCSFAIALAIDKTRIWIWFGGSIEKLFILAAGIFALIKWGTYMAFRRRDEPKQDMPDVPLK
ncbi:MAG: hypothetical protein C0404_06160 [Verrucomicrobia bacterium]|nr:hypothetical protein [Verrucomicrobiota bacterium]